MNAIESALNNLGQRVNALPGQNGRPAANAGGDKLIVSAYNPIFFFSANIVAYSYSGRNCYNEPAGEYFLVRDNTFLLVLTSSTAD